MIKCVRHRRSMTFQGCCDLRLETSQLPYRMTLSPAYTFSLQRHPACPASAVDSIEVDIEDTEFDGLRLHYRLQGDIKQLAIPARNRPQHADELWRHSCFEAFASRGDSPAYCEFNFSPSCEWAAYSFRRYRENMTSMHPGICIPIEVRTSSLLLELRSRIPLSALQLLAAEGQLRMALAAVVEERSGRFSYWALAHPASAPDFHHPQSFAVTLQQPPTACSTSPPAGMLS